MLVFLGIVLIAIGVGVIVLSGIASQADSLSERLHAGADEIESLVRGLGIDQAAASDAKESASTSVTGAFKVLTEGLADGRPLQNRELVGVTQRATLVGECLPSALELPSPMRRPFPGDSAGADDGGG